MIVIDVREELEYLKEGYIKGSLNIPLSKIGEKISIFNKDQDIVLVCKSGRRAGVAVELLKELGYSNVKNGGSFSSFQKE